MPGIELSVIPCIDISIRVTGVTDGKEGEASLMTRRDWKGGMFQGYWDRQCRAGRHVITGY